MLMNIPGCSFKTFMSKQKSQAIKYTILQVDINMKAQCKQFPQQ